MTRPTGLRHTAFAPACGAGVVQLRMTVAVAIALVIGIGLGAASIAPRSGWHAANAAPVSLTRDAWLVRPADARG